MPRAAETHTVSTALDTFDQPVTGTSLISTRRFWALSSSVFMLAIGWVSPNPRVPTRPLLSTRAAGLPATERARRSDKTRV